jgi:hypothetical protein
MKKVKILIIVFTIFLIGCFASTRSSKPHSEPDGIRGIKWGTEISTLEDMERVEQGKSSNSDLVWYIREGDALTIGKAKLENIFYFFWMGNFESVWIDFKGDENFEILKKELFKLFGKTGGSEEYAGKRHKKAGIEPSKTEGEDFFHAWWGKNTDAVLSYSKDRHMGTLDIRSTIISEERRAYEKEKEKEERLRKRGF